MLGAVIDSEWATGLDHKVARCVIQSYRRDFGNARVSERYLARVTGSERRNAMRSLNRLIDKGVFYVLREGSRTRPTEYGINFDFGSGGVIQNATVGGVIQDATGGVQNDAFAHGGGVLQDGESYLQDRLTSRSTEVGTTHAAASTGATRPSTAMRDPAGFNELWAAYSRKKDRAKAKDAYKALAPDAELQALLVETARAWFAQYEANGTEPEYRKCLHTWLEGECWLEDLPVPYVKRDTRVKAPRKSRASDTSAPVGRHFVKIVEAKLIQHDPNNSDLFFRHKIVSGQHAEAEFVHEVPYMRTDGCAVNGSEAFSAVRRAAQVSDSFDMTELVGAMLDVSVSKGGQITYDASA